MNPLTLLLVCVAGWMNRQQQLVIEYLQEEIRVLKAQSGHRARFTDDQRRRLAATDFFTVEVWTASGLVRYHVLFVMRLMTREVHIAGIIPEPESPWMSQIARNLTDSTEGFLRGCRFLIQDRSVLFTAQFREILQSAGVVSIRLPVCSPNLNAFAERFVRSIKESCLDRQIFLGERALREAVTEFVAHYHSERNHQGLDNKIIQANFAPFHENAPVKCRSRVGGQLNY